MWLALLGRLNTRQRLYERDVLQENQTTCVFCARQSETSDHILLLCPCSQLIWSTLAAEFGQSLSVETSFKEHYERWMTKSWKRGLSKKIWMVTFFAVTWNIWLTRNGIIFHNKSFNHEITCQNIKRHVAFWTRAWKDELPCSEAELARYSNILPAILQ